MNVFRIALPGAPGRSQLAARKASRPRLMIESLEQRAMLAVFTVSNVDDSGPGSLRQAVMDANGTPGADTINFAVPGPATIELFTGPLEITDAVEIDGTIFSPGPEPAEPITVRSSTSTRVMNVASPFLEGVNSVFIVDMNILGPGMGTVGGGLDVSAASNLILDRVTISDGVSPSGSGGGIRNLGSTTIRNSTISGNSASADGGGIANDGNGTLVLYNSTVSGNIAADRGGGVFAAAGSSATITRSTITGNSAANGGGLYASPGAQVSLHNSIVGGNTATSGPDVSATKSESFDVIIELTPPTLDGDVTASGWVGALRSTNAANAESGVFQGNPAAFPAQSGSGYVGMNYQSTTPGAGTISTWILSPVINMNNGDTFSFYTRTTDDPVFPDRLEVRQSLASASLNVGAGPNTVGDFTNLLLTVNPTLTTTGYPDVWTQYNVTISGLMGTTSGRLAFRYFVTDGGPTGANSDYIGIDNFQYTAAVAADHSLIESPNGHRIMNGVAGNIVGVSPNLGPLANNGGPTRTHLPNPGSMVINAGSGSRVTDQRLFTGVVGPAVDIGSVEVQAASLNLDFNNDGFYNCGDMTLLETAIDGGVFNPAFDVNGDSLLSSADVFEWLMDAGELRFGAGRFFKPGDANLDGTVDGQDFIIWNANKFTPANRWCLGDFNQDNTVDGQDFIVWNANKFTSSDLARGSNVTGGAPTGLAAEREDLTLSPRTAGSTTNIATMVGGRDVSSAAQTRLSRGMRAEPQAAVFAARGSEAGIVFKRPSSALPLSDFARHLSAGSGVSAAGSSSVDQQFAPRTLANIGTRPNSAISAIARAKSTVRPALTADRVDAVHRML